MGIHYVCINCGYVHDVAKHAVSVGTDKRIFGHVQQRTSATYRHR